MTDWLPWGGALMAGTFATLHFILKAMEARMPEDVDVRNARRAFWAALALSALTYAMYLAFGEGWLPYT